ncbi:hypothetical protein [Streptomyces sp. NPDC001068]|uniref:hypothetical protein n=1 Tax=Streptomyces sp. NPDC001068 TaxID=3364544 RepID=UPI0036B3B502
MAVPTDPRTPHQRVRDQLAAARARLVQEGVSRRERAQIADRIHTLTEQARLIGA